MTIMENKTNIKYNVKDKKEGRMYAVPDPIDYDDISEDERELLNAMADPHFNGPGYDE
jgi:hypothetical protein